MLALNGSALVDPPPGQSPRARARDFPTGSLCAPPSAGLRAVRRLGWAWGGALDWIAADWLVRAILALRTVEVIVAPGLRPARRELARTGLAEPTALVEDRGRRSCGLTHPARRMLGTRSSRLR